MLLVLHITWEAENFSLQLQKQDEKTMFFFQVFKIVLIVFSVLYTN